MPWYKKTIEKTILDCPGFHFYRVVHFIFFYDDREAFFDSYTVKSTLRLLNFSLAEIMWNWHVICQCYFSI